MATVYNQISRREVSFNQNQLRDVVLIVCLNHQRKGAIRSLCIHAVLLCVALAALLQDLTQSLNSRSNSWGISV